MAVHDAVINTPIPATRLAFSLTGDALSGLVFVDDTVPLKAPSSSQAQHVAAQIEAYFQNARFRFQLPLSMSGTAFQKRVWQAMMDIPVGETRSYGDVARRLNSGPRAVGGASRANPLPLVVPCHRIVGKQGLGGFMGGATGALAIKSWLLHHEQRA